MTDTPNSNNVSRRNVLRKGAFASGAAFLGGTTIVGTSTAIDESFGFVPDGVDVRKTGTVTLVTRIGKERVKCAFRGSSYEIDTEVFKVDAYSGKPNNEKIYIASNRFEEEDEVKFIDVNYDCPEGLKEVDLGSVDF